MSLRKLPELRLPGAIAGTAANLAERAVKAWEPGVMAKAEDDANITIFDVIGEDWFGDGVSPNRIAAALRSIGDKPVTVQINSPGGSYDDGLAIYNLLRLHPAKVTTQVVGMAASAASIIAMAGDEIQIAKAGHMMVHNVQWVAIGDRHVMKAAYDAMEVFDQTLTQLYVDRTGLEASAVRGMLDAETYMSGSEAVDKGFADKLLPGDLVKDEAGVRPTALYRVEAALAAGRPMPRAERRKLLKEILEGTPGAADEVVMPSADAATGADNGSAELTLALAKLKLVAA